MRNNATMHISDLEGQEYLCRALIYLKTHENSFMAQMLKEEFGDTTAPTMYRVMKKLLDLGLVTDRLDGALGKGTIKRIYMLTPIGNEVASRMMEIEQILTHPGKYVKK